MKIKNWNEGLNHIDSDLIEEFVQKSEKIEKRQRRKNIWLRLGAIAASFVLIAGIISTVPFLYKQAPDAVPDPGTQDASGGMPDFGTADESNNPGIPITSIQISTPAPQYCGSESSVGGGGNVVAEINTEGISVTARLLGTLPDTYTFYDDWEQTEFRLLKMETVKLIKGQKMTDMFYYIVPIRFMTDFTLFDTFVIVDMGQYGYEHSVLYNKTDGCAEQIDAALFGYVNVYFHHLSENILAFDENGQFDARLWESTDAWKESTGWPSRAHLSKYIDGYTLQQAETEHRGSVGDRYAHELKGVTGEAAEALEYIKSFENGLFIPRGDGFIASSSSEVSFPFRRYFGGYATNEGGIIYEDSVHYSKARFTREDEESLPDLTSAIASVTDAFEKGMITPPHIQGYTELINTTYGIFGWYAKTADGVLGIVRVTWCYRSERYELFFDDMYYTIEYGSDVCDPIDRDALIEKLGDYEKTYIYNGEYDENGKIFTDICY